MRLFHPIIFILFFCTATSKAQLQFDLDFEKFKHELDSTMAVDPSKEMLGSNNIYILVYIEDWNHAGHSILSGDSSFYERNKYAFDPNISYAGAHGCMYMIFYRNDEYLVLYCSLPVSMPISRWLYFRRKI